MELDKYIAKQIILAQVASDGGKGIRELQSLFPIASVYCKKAYYVKDVCIKNAIKAIQKKPNTGFRYHVTVDYAVCGGYKHVFVVYFNFKLDGENRQISFHTFANLWKYVNRKCPTRWKKKYNSRETALDLADALNLSANRIIATGDAQGITLGKSYTIREETFSNYVIKNDFGKIEHYYQGNFIRKGEKSK